jgi:exodeoxyribonuclease-3
MRLVSWNVNGLRAVFKKGFPEWLEVHQPDVVAIQEIKCSLSQLDESLTHPCGYQSWFFPAAKAGYSGVALYCKQSPLQVMHGLGEDEFDSEGRSLTAEFPDFYLIGAYFPNAQGAGRRLDYKLRFLEWMQLYVQRLAQRGKPVLVCGDFNIAHQEIDIHDPRGNRNQAGFLPEERAWMTQMLERGYQDLFRQQHPEPEQYTWWSYLNFARKRNKGWRIDYFMGDPSFQIPYRSRHYPEVEGSDHCPVELELL